eukprot:scaffold8311_cov18-Tisochrysis_lutea.AAC.1
MSIEFTDDHWSTVLACARRRAARLSSHYIFFFIACCRGSTTYGALKAMPVSPCHVGYSFLLLLLTFSAALTDLASQPCD